MILKKKHTTFRVNYKLSKTIFINLLLFMMFFMFGFLLSVFLYQNAIISEWYNFIF